MTEQAIDLYTDSDELEPLSDKEQEYLRLIIQDGVKPASAYRRTHDPDGRLADATIYSASSRLQGSRKIQVWRQAMVAAGLHRGVIQQDEYITEMQALAERCERTGNMGAAVLAKSHAGKVAGLYVDRYEDVTKRELSIDDLLALVRKLVGSDLADQMATRLGLETQETQAIEHQDDAISMSVITGDEVRADQEHVSQRK